MSAWGPAFGDAWGEAFGPNGPAPIVVTVDTHDDPGRHERKRKAREELREQITFALETHTASSPLVRVVTAKASAESTIGIGESLIADEADDEEALLVALL